MNLIQLAMIAVLIGGCLGAVATSGTLHGADLGALQTAELCEPAGHAGVCWPGS